MERIYKQALEEYKRELLLESQREEFSPCCAHTKDAIKINTSKLLINSKPQAN